MNVGLALSRSPSPLSRATGRKTRFYSAGREDVSDLEHVNFLNVFISLWQRSK